MCLPTSQGKKETLIKPKREENNGPRNDMEMLEKKEKLCVYVCVG